MSMRSFAIKFCVAATLTLALLAGGECLAFFSLPPRTVPVSRYKPYVVWEDYPPQDPHTHLDPDGLRLTHNSHCGAGEFTIWMFGGSALWGAYLSDEQTLASLLAQHYQDFGRPACVKNYGERAWASTQEIVKLIRELKRTSQRPDLVLFYDGAIDSILPKQTDEPDPHMYFPQFRDYFEEWNRGRQRQFEYLKRSNTYVALSWLSRLMGIAGNPNDPGPISDSRAMAMAVRTRDNYLANLELIQTLAAHYGFRYLAYWEPVLPAQGKPLTSSEEEWRAGEELFDPGSTMVVRTSYALFRTLHRPDLVYLGDVFQGRHETLFRPGNHLGPEGAQLVAERMFQALRERGW